MKNILIISIFYFFIGDALGQEKKNKGGEFELGLRSTASLFSAESASGFGTGGQFRIRLGDRLNTEWYADLIKNNIEDLGSRTDSHIGWSVMFYPGKIDTKISPYLIAGHCFDYTKVVSFSTPTKPVAEVDRLSSAVQVGLGTSWNISERVNFSLSSQYMMHLGEDIHAEVHGHHGVNELHIEQGEHTGVEGHLLVTLSMNFLIADLWTKD